MGSPRDTYKYHFKVGNKIRHSGITTNLVRRQSEHKRIAPSGHIVKVGRRTTKSSALRWRRDRY